MNRRGNFARSVRRGTARRGQGNRYVSARLRALRRRQFISPIAATRMIHRLPTDIGRMIRTRALRMRVRNRAATTLQRAWRARRARLGLRPATAQDYA